MWSRRHTKLNVCYIINILNLSSIMFGLHCATTTTSDDRYVSPTQDKTTVIPSESKHFHSCLVICLLFWISPAIDSTAVVKIFANYRDDLNSPSKPWIQSKMTASQHAKSGIFLERWALSTRSHFLSVCYFYPSFAPLDFFIFTYCSEAIQKFPVWLLTGLTWLDSSLEKETRKIKDRKRTQGMKYFTNNLKRG